LRQLQRILVVEDEFLISLDLQQQLTDLGYVCVGPAQTVSDAMALVESSDELRLDAAVLDLFVAGERVDRLCDLLDRKRIPFAFATGASAETDLGRWAGHPCIEKPFGPAAVRQLVEGLLGK
jgi:DNA-binding response OmpR family regulator